MKVLGPVDTYMSRFSRSGENPEMTYKLSYFYTIDFDTCIKKVLAKVKYKMIYYEINYLHIKKTVFYMCMFGEWEHSLIVI